MILDVILALIVLLTLQFNISKRTSIVSPLMVDYMTINQKNESEKLTIYQGIELQICNYAHVEIPSVLDPIVMECSEFRAFFWAFSQSPTIPPTEDRGLCLRDCNFCPITRNQQQNVRCLYGNLHTIHKQ